jgi:hypothetical protein
MKAFAKRVKRLENDQRGDPHKAIVLRIPKTILEGEEDAWIASQLGPCDCGGPSCPGRNCTSSQEN